MYEINEHGELRPSSKKLMSRIVCVEVIILFAALLLAMAYSTGGLPEDIPQFAEQMFLVSTITISLSSAIMLFIVRWQANSGARVALMGLVFLLAGAFLLSQLYGFSSAYNFLKNNPAAMNIQLLYAVVGIHGVHVVGGIALLLVLLIKVLIRRFNDDRNQSLRLLEPYWHLLTLVWLVFWLIL